MDITQQTDLTDFDYAAAALVADTCNEDDDHLLISNLSFINGIKSCAAISE
jgi:hypothetical protein